MTRYKRISALVMCMCLAALLPLSAHAAVLETNEPLSLTVRYMDGEEPVTGAPFRLYKVATLNDDLSLTADSTFTDFQDDIEDPDIRWDVLAEELESFVNDKSVVADDEGKVNDSGIATFPTGSSVLEPGVYLLVSQRFRHDGMIYYPSPVIITLPNQDVYGNWICDVTAHAKFVPIEDEPIDLIVTKKWNDRGNEYLRPSEITVILLKDGRECERIKLHSNNDWTYLWNDLDPIHEWSVTEVEVAGYETKISEPTVTDNVWMFIINNKYIPPTSPQLPQTGQLKWPIPVLLASGAVLFLLGCFLRFSRRKDDYA